MTTQSRSLSFILGILLLILGLFAVGSEVFLTYASVVFLGWILLIGGIFEFVWGLFSGSVGGLFLAMIGGILSFFIGALIITNPAVSAATLTFLIATIFVVSGSYKIISSLFLREANWGWALTGGIIIFLLGIMVLAHWPQSSLRLIGFFIGLEILVNGFILTARAFQPVEEVHTHELYLSGVKGGKAEKRPPHSHQKRKVTYKH